MRNQILTSLHSKMKYDDTLFFLTADMGIGLVDPFIRDFPDRYLNVGIAEQSLIGVSAGLAHLGFRPFAYTISNFAVHRCFEQLRNDVALHHLPITVLGTSCGYDNAPLGPTHHVIDDWGVISCIPGIDVYCPLSVPHASILVDSILRESRPTYVRIPKGEPKHNFELGDIVHIQGDTTDIALIAYGSTVENCLAAQKLHTALSLIFLNRLVPLPPGLDTLITQYRRVIVVEDHFSGSGLFSAIAKIIVSQSIKTKIESLAPQTYSFTVGQKPEYFHDLLGISTTAILTRVNQYDGY